MTRHITIGLALIVGLAVSVQAQTVIYVDGDSPYDRPGNDWGHAYHYLQDALAAASAGTEVWVAEGTYRPDESTANPTGTGNREATFRLINGVAVRGGYRGLDNGGDPNDRGFTSTLSGDIGTPGDNTDNSRHVVTGSGTDATAVLDGFTITGGYADGAWPQNCGGGMFNDAGGPVVANCAFVGNEADILGGGMYNYMGSPGVDKCTFIGNTANTGGGICNDYASATVTNSTFGGNSAAHTGGGMINLGGSSTVDNCTFIGNEAHAGGGLDNDNASATVANCAFIGNTSHGDGGGMYNVSSNLTVLNCAFSNNLARGGPYIYGGGMHNSNCSLTVTNCTFNGNYARAGTMDFG